MSPRSKTLVAAFTVAITLVAVAAFRADRAPAPMPVEGIEESEGTSPASPASEPRKSSAKSGAVLVDARVLPAKEGRALVSKLVAEKRISVVSGNRELSRKEIETVLREDGSEVLVDANGTVAVRTKRGRAPVRVVAREEGESLADALLREEREEREVEAAKSASVEYGAAGGSWGYEKSGAIATRGPAALSRDARTVEDGIVGSGDVSGQIQLASAGAPIAAIVPHGVKEFAPTPAPTPAFCPEGTSEQWKKTKTSKERYCLKADRGGVPVKHGPFVTTYPSGKKRVEGSYENGRAQGEWIEYHPNGRKSEEGPYLNGRRHGTWASYWASGALQSRGEYRNGLKQGKWTWFDDRGRKESEGEIRTADNLEHEQGTWTYYHANGTKRAQGVMKNGRREGRWTEWSADGRVVSVDHYRGGEKEG